MSRQIEEIESNGWTRAEFGVPDVDMANYAKLANTVIDIARDSPRIKDALAFDGGERKESGPVRTALYGLSGARNSRDVKHTLHVGYGSRIRAARRVPESRQPAELRDLWQANRDVLAAIKQSTARAFKEIGAKALLSTIFPRNTEDSNIILRTVRYVGAQQQQIGSEIISGHVDLGLATLHLFETHGGWIKGGAYPTSVMTANDSPERAAQVRAIRQNLQPIDSSEGMAPFFLGATWQTLPEVPKDLHVLPGCYHAGFAPPKDQEVISPYADKVTFGEPDRVSVIGFMNPELKRVGNYPVPSVENCRPEFELRDTA